MITTTNARLTNKFPTPQKQEFEMVRQYSGLRSLEEAYKATVHDQCFDPPVSLQIVFPAKSVSPDTIPKPILSPWTLSAEQVVLPLWIQSPLQKFKTSAVTFSFYRF